MVVGYHHLRKHPYTVYSLAISSASIESSPIVIMKILSPRHLVLLFLVENNRSSKSPDHATVGSRVSRLGVPNFEICNHFFQLLFCFGGREGDVEVITYGPV